MIGSLCTAESTLWSWRFASLAMSFGNARYHHEVFRSTVWRLDGTLGKYITLSKAQMVVGIFS